MIDWLRETVTPERRVKAAGVALAFSVFAWPTTALTVFRGEPQGILGLSWAAIILALLQIVLATDIRKQQEDGEGA